MVEQQQRLVQDVDGGLRQQRQQDRVPGFRLPSLQRLPGQPAPGPGEERRRSAGRLDRSRMCASSRRRYASFSSSTLTAAGLDTSASHAPSPARTETRPALSTARCPSCATRRTRRPAADVRYGSAPAPRTPAARPSAPRGAATTGPPQRPEPPSRHRARIPHHPPLRPQPRLAGSLPRAPPRRVVRRIERVKAEGVTKVRTRVLLQTRPGATSPASRCITSERMRYAEKGLLPRRAAVPSPYRLRSECCGGRERPSLSGAAARMS